MKVCYTKNAVFRAKGTTRSGEGQVKTIVTQDKKEKSYFRKSLSRLQTPLSESVVQKPLAGASLMFPFDY